MLLEISAVVFLIIGAILLVIEVNSDERALKKRERSDGGGSE